MHQILCFFLFLFFKCILKILYTFQDAVSCGWIYLIWVVVIASKILSFSLHWMLYSVLVLSTNIYFILIVVFWLFMMCWLIFAKISPSLSSDLSTYESVWPICCCFLIVDIGDTISQRACKFINSIIFTQVGFLR